MNLDLEDTRRDLIAMRTRLGADTPAGHRCSNIVAQLEALKTATDKEQRKAIKDRHQATDHGARQSVRSGVMFYAEER